MDKGPEDTPGWAKESDAQDSSVVLTCDRCKKTIKFWHCANTGCPWCNACGVENKEKRP